MHWVLQENLINPTTRAQVEALLRERDIGYTLATLIPFVNVLAEDIEVPAGRVFAYGSTGLGPVARDKGWDPGYFDANLDYQLMLEKYGDYCLNAQAVHGELGQIDPPWGEFFTRPLLDNKSYPGSVMTRAEFDTFRQGVANVADAPLVTLRLSDMVVAAPLTHILYEYRFFVIAGEVLTGSRYKAGDRVFSTANVPAEVRQFAQCRANQWSPNQAYAIDIAYTPAGLKVIEVNSANSAGFYACDIGAIIDAVNAKLG